jgi:hypothetical protein
MKMSFEEIAEFLGNLETGIPLRILFFVEDPHHGNHCSTLDAYGGAEEKILVESLVRHWEISVSGAKILPEFLPGSTTPSRWIYTFTDQRGEFKFEVLRIRLLE